MLVVNLQQGVFAACRANDTRPIQTYQASQILSLRLGRGMLSRSAWEMVIARRLKLCPTLRPVIAMPSSPPPLPLHSGGSISVPLSVLITISITVTISISITMLPDGDISISPSHPPRTPPSTLSPPPPQGSDPSASLDHRPCLCHPP